MWPDCMTCRTLIGCQLGSMTDAVADVGGDGSVCIAGSPDE